MSTQIATKMTFFAAALVMNGLIALGMGALFDAQTHSSVYASASPVPFARV
jgi:hypothetical protein